MVSGHGEKKSQKLYFFVDAVMTHKTVEAAGISRATHGLGRLRSIFRWCSSNPSKAVMAAGSTRIVKLSELTKRQ